MLILNLYKFFFFFFFFLRADVPARLFPLKIKNKKSMVTASTHKMYQWVFNGSGFITSVAIDS